MRDVLSLGGGAERFECGLGLASADSVCACVRVCCGEQEEELEVSKAKEAQLKASQKEGRSQVRLTRHLSPSSTSSA